LLGDGIFDPDILDTRKEISNIDLEILDKAGRKHHLLINVKRISIKDGTVLYSCRDITERRQVADALEKSLRNQEWRIQERTKELSCLYGVSKIAETATSTEVMIKEIVNLIPPGWQYPDITSARIIFNSNKYLSENFQESAWIQTAEIFVFQQPLGFIEVFYHEEMPVKEEGPFLKEERVLINAVAETTGKFIERLRAGKALRESEEKYLDLYDNAPDMYVSVDAKTTVIIECNQTVCDKTGYTKEEVLNRSVFDMYTRNSAEYAKTGIFPAFKKTGVITGEELQLQCKDGSTIDVSLRVSAVRDENGNILHSRSSWRDISVRKQLEARLIQAERLAATGQLATTIAHEINSPLHGIASLIGLLKETYKIDKDLQEDLRLINEGFRSIKQTVKRLMDLNRPGKEPKQQIFINEVIKDTLSLVEAYIRQSGIKIFLNLSGRIPEISGSPQQLGHVFMNLINNAVEAVTLPPAGESSLKKAGAQKELTIETKLRKGNVIISLRDTGPGILTEDIGRIFDPFYTTKKTLGMGVGLSICHGYIENHNGKISAKNSSSGGAVFTITLPVGKVKK